MATQPGGEQKLRFDFRIIILYTCVLRQLAQQFGLDFDKLANSKQMAALRRALTGQQALRLPSSVGQTINENDTSAMKPIKPANVNEEASIFIRLKSLFT